MVAILMSTYNGEKYIKEQIESIYAQTYKDFQLFVRDDGSEKKFVEQLEKLQQEYGFALEKGENVGFLPSFMWLLSSVDQADYFAFADQDDIWYPQKIQMAVEWMERQKDKDTPLLFHSAYDIVDTQGKVIDTFCFDNRGYDFRKSITENHYSGFSMVINGVLRTAMLKADLSELDYHDWWAAMIAHALGTGYFDKQVMAKHRSHGDNVTTFNFATRLRWLVENMTKGSEIRKRAGEFKKCFYDKLDTEQKKIIDLFCSESYDLKKALKKCFYYKKWRSAWSSELTLRFLMLVGKI
ncbi:MAG: glycosyltransferase [Lachnospiraceae bacterium]|nr:glycosyltransferase [Lachnospiraceae bacterium]